jgi:5-(carboxyamino)imidazole ribonucleotide mutase
LLKSIKMVTNLSRPLVGIVMGSDSDLPIMKDAFSFLEDNGIASEIKILSAHRTPERMVKYAKAAKKKGIRVIIAGAGGSAHLPGMIASLTTLPVIGVPIMSSKLKGIDSFLSIVQMPPGVPVACVAINGALNAAILACQILGLESKPIESRLLKYKKSLYSSVVAKSNRLQGRGPKEYLKLKRGYSK